MKKRDRLAVLLLLAVLLVPAAARADFGPKPGIRLTVTNPPEEEYYLDLLIQERGAGGSIPYTAEEYAAKRLDAAMFEQLFCLADAGWYPVLAGGESLPWESGLTAFSFRGEREHYISEAYAKIYAKDFRIIVVTASGTVRVSEPVRRQTFYVNITYDYLENEIHLFPLAVVYLIQFASTCIPTLLIEGVLLLVYGFSLRKSGKVFLITNVATQVFMTATLGTALIYGSVGGALLVIVPVEIVIIVAEAKAYLRFFNEQPKYRRRAYAIVANLVSFLIGFASCWAGDGGFTSGLT